MRPIAFLAFLLPTLAASPAALASDPTLAASPAALASDFDFEPLQQKLSMELQERIDQTVLAAVAARVERQLGRALALPAIGRAIPERVGVGRAPARATLAGPVAPVASDSDARPVRMTCRASSEYALECVVVAKRSNLERVAQVH